MNRYIIAVFIFILTGCELIVDVDVPFDHKQLTVNAFVNPDSLWKAEVSLNRFILSDSPYTKIENSTVAVYEDGQLLATLLHLGNGIYQSATEKPVEGKSYELRVSADGYTPVTAHTSVPVPVPITSADVTINGSQEVIVRLRFNDPPEEKNYYLVTLESQRERASNDGSHIITYQNLVHIESKDPSIQNDNPATDVGVYVRDVFFDGQEANLTFTTGTAGALYAGGATVTLRTLSEDYYNYKTTVMLQSNTSGNPFAQPVNVYNNMDGGFGLFAGYSQSVFVSDDTSPRPVITEITPMRGKPSDRIIIRGENLASESNYHYNAVVFMGDFNGVQLLQAYASIVQYGDHELEVVVPPRAITGKIAVYVNNRVVISDQEFEVIE